MPHSPPNGGSTAPVEGEGEDLFAGADLEGIYGLGDDRIYYAENPFDDAETFFQNALNTSNEEVEQNFVSISSFLQPQQQPLQHHTTFHTYAQSTSTKNLDMANFEDNSKLHLLADVALGTYMQEGQQQADATTQQESSNGGEQQAEVTTPQNSSSDGEQQTDATTPQEPSGSEEQQADATTPQDSSSDGEQSAHATAAEIPSEDEDEEAQVPANQGLTAVNATAPRGKLTLNDPQPFSNSLSAAALPPPQVTSGSAGHAAPGFNRETGRGVLTSVCGIVTQSKGTAVRGGGQGKYHCPRCNGGFTRPRSVKDHFIKCVEKYGNPNGHNWYDHHTLAKSREWFRNHS